MFDPSAPHIIILLVVVLILFGSTRLPGAAEALGKSMRIFRSEAKKMHDEPAKTTQATITPPATPQPLPGQPPADTQQQLADIQRQLQELQQQNSGGQGSAAQGAPLSEAQRNQQSR